LDHSGEVAAALEALSGRTTTVSSVLGHDNRCVGVSAAGEVARRRGDAGLTTGRLQFSHRGAAGHFYAAYCVNGMEFELDGVAADSCVTASYGGTLVIRSETGAENATLVGNTFGYGARGGDVFIAGRAGNRFGICLRKNHEGGGPRIVVEGIEANGFQYMTGGCALLLGPAGRNLGSGMTGGRIYAFDLDENRINRDYVAASELDDCDVEIVRELLTEHIERTGSVHAACLAKTFDPAMYRRIQTRLLPEVHV
jgi:glutamate synthase domain-containing protein 3